MALVKMPAVLQATAEPITSKRPVAGVMIELGDTDMLIFLLHNSCTGYDRRPLTPSCQ